MFIRSTTFTPATGNTIKKIEEYLLKYTIIYWLVYIT